MGQAISELQKERTLILGELAVVGTTAAGGCNAIGTLAGLQDWVREWRGSLFEEQSKYTSFVLFMEMKLRQARVLVRIRAAANARAGHPHPAFTHRPFRPAWAPPSSGMAWPQDMTQPQWSTGVLHTW